MDGPPCLADTHSYALYEMYDLWPEDSLTWLGCNKHGVIGVRDDEETPIATFTPQDIKEASLCSFDITTSLQQAQENGDTCAKYILSAPNTQGIYFEKNDPFIEDRYIGANSDGQDNDGVIAQFHSFGAPEHLRPRLVVEYSGSAVVTPQQKHKSSTIWGSSQGVHFNVANKRESRISIFTLQGKELHSRNLSQSGNGMFSLSPGMYMVYLQSQHEKHIQKVIVSR